MIALIASAAWAASPPEIGAVVREQVAYDATRDFALEDFLVNSVYARTFGRFETDRGDRWFFEGRFQNHVSLRDTNPAASLDAHVEGWTDVGLGETGWSGKVGGPVDLRLGALIEPWGRLNVLSVTDVLNPRDARQGLLTPPEYLKIPVPMAVVGVGAKGFRAETVLIPFAGHDRLYLRETNWSPVRQGWTPDLILDMEGWLPPDSDQTLTTQELLDSIHGLAIDPDPSTRRALDEALLANHLPQALWGNGEIAERIELTGSRGMVAVMGGSLRATQPETSLNPEIVDILRTQTLPDTSDAQALLDLQEKVLGNFVDVSWPRTWVAGADGSALVGPLQVSGEAMWTQKSIVRLPYARATTVPSLGVGASLMYLRGSSLAITLEGRYVHLFDPPQTLLLSRPDHVQVAAIARWTTMRNRLMLQAGGLFDPTFLEYAAAGPAVTYRATDHLQFELGGVVLIGSTAPPTGLLDSTVDALTYAGGPISFIQTNDSITFAVQFVY